MNTSIHKKEGIESIGGITPEIALKQAYGIVHVGDTNIFHGKTILDVGAGFSDLLQYISEHAESSRMIAVDPIYGGQESQAKAYTLKSIQEFIDVILSDPDSSNDEFLLQMRMNAERQKHVIRQFSTQTTSIERYREIPNTIDADYVFVINVLYAAQDPKSLLGRMDQELGTNGEIIIIDYIGRCNAIDRKIKNTGIEIKHFEQYFVVKLRKGDIRKIDWSKK